MVQRNSISLLYLAVASHITDIGETMLFLSDGFSRLLYAIQIFRKAVADTWSVPKGFEGSARQRCDENLCGADRVTVTSIKIDPKLEGYMGACRESE